METSTDAAQITERARARAVRERAWLVVVLAVTSGATDAIGFLALGSAFTSVMTGNMVLLGVGAADRDLDLILSCLVAILSFVLGAAIGARVAGNPEKGDALWPKPVTVALYVELVLLLGFAVCWFAAGGAPDKSWLLPMLGVNAAALGLQSSAIQRFGVSGLSTTYLTGTLTTVVIKLITGHGLRKVVHSLAILGGLILGAAVGTVLVEYAPLAVPSVQLVTLGVVLVTVHLSKHLHHRPV
jgi:uncharacterized membrane protein YoaK (UPF0700 family)